MTDLATEAGGIEMGQLTFRDIALGMRRGRGRRRFRIVPPGHEQTREGHDSDSHDHCWTGFGDGVMGHQRHRDTRMIRGLEP